MRCKFFFVALLEKAVNLMDLVSVHLRLYMVLKNIVDNGFVEGLEPVMQGLAISNRWHQRIVPEFVSSLLIMDTSLEWGWERLASSKTCCRRYKFRRAYCHGQPKHPDLDITKTPDSQQFPPPKQYHDQSIWRQSRSDIKDGTSDQVDYESRRGDRARSTTILSHFKIETEEWQYHSYYNWRHRDRDWRKRSARDATRLNRNEQDNIEASRVLHDGPRILAAFTKNNDCFDFVCWEEESYFTHKKESIQAEKD